MVAYNHKAAICSLRGAQNKAEGDGFEELIETAAKIYADKKIAFIEKTPEPFRITGSLGNGKFAGHFTKQAQPDFKGTLKGGKSIVFDAKATCTDRIKTSVLSDEQRKDLTLHRELGAETGVLLCFNFREFAWIPYADFINAKELNGHEYWSREEARAYAVHYRDGYLDFLTARRTEV